MTEVGCIRAASASVETVFSGAGKFMEEAPSAGGALLRMMVRCHVNYGYWFLRPTIEEVVARYNQKHHPNRGSAGTAAGAELAASQKGSEQPKQAASGEEGAAHASAAPDLAAAAAAAGAAAGAVAKAAAEAAVRAGASPAAAAAAAVAAVESM